MHSVMFCPKPVTHATCNSTDAAVGKAWIDEDGRVSRLPRSLDSSCFEALRLSRLAQVPTRVQDLTMPMLMDTRLELTGMVSG